MDKPEQPMTPEPTELPKKARRTRLIDLTPGPGRIVRIDRFHRLGPETPETPEKPPQPGGDSK